MSTGLSARLAERTAAFDPGEQLVDVAGRAGEPREAQDRGNALFGRQVLLFVGRIASPPGVRAGTYPTSSGSEGSAAYSDIEAS